MLLNPSIEKEDVTSLAQKAEQEARLFSLPEGWEQDRESVPGITLDGESTLDRDDAIWLERTDDGGYKLRVSIADVSSFISPDMAIAAFAEEMGETHYLATHNDPMMPHEISEGRLSLLENQDTPTFSLTVTLDKNARVVGEPVFSQDRMEPRRMTYDEANGILHGNGDPADIEMMKTYRTFANQLLHRRREAGAIPMFDHNPTDEANSENVLTQTSTSFGGGELIVQECMIFANTVTAQFMRDNNIPGLFRNHLMKEGVSIDDVKQLTNSGTLHDVATIESMFGRATYGTKPTGHDGLGIGEDGAYMHTTSPLRRFADYVTQANLIAFLHGEELPYSVERLEAIAEHINEIQHQNRKAEQAEAKRATAISRLGFTALELNSLTLPAQHRVVGAINEEWVEEIPTEIIKFIRERAELGKLDACYLSILALSKHRGRKGWEDVQDAIATQLTNAPHEAREALRQILSTGKLVETHQPQIHYDDKLRKNSCLHAVHLPGDPENVITATGWGRSERLAIIRSGAQIIARLAGIEIEHLELTAA